MNPFDVVIIAYINQFSERSFVFDRLVHFIGTSDLLKGGVIVTIIWWVWFTFTNEAHQSDKRERVIATLISCIVALALARSLALVLPFRPRPVHEASLHFLLPYGASLTTLEGWSSFPSDHAALFFALATGLLFVSRKAGILALSYTTLFICLPRIYLGYHWPTDVIVGAILGMTFALLSNIYLIKSKLLQLIANWSYSEPGLFYPLFFLFTYQIADLFAGGRAVIGAVVKLLQTILS